MLALHAEGCILFLVREAPEKNIIARQNNILFGPYRASNPRLSEFAGFSQKVWFATRGFADEGLDDEGLTVSCQRVREHFKSSAQEFRYLST